LLAVAAAAVSNRCGDGCGGGARGGDGTAGYAGSQGNDGGGCEQAGGNATAAGVRRGQSAVVERSHSIGANGENPGACGIRTRAAAEERNGESSSHAGSHTPRC